MIRYHTTREGWMQSAIEVFRGWFAELDIPLAPVLISVGYPDTGRRKGCRGVTYLSELSGGTSTLFISPELDDLVQLLRTTLHELIHVSDDCASGHKGHFVQVATALGFVAPFTDSQHVTPELDDSLKRLAADLGPFGGHLKFDIEAGMTLAALLPGVFAPIGSERKVRTSSMGKPQTNRWMKYECEQGSGFAVRTSRGQAEKFGPPLCPCHKSEMVPENSVPMLEVAA